MERPITFRNRKGETLFGMLHVPEHEQVRPRIGVNLLNPGLKSRVAPNRLNVKTARLLCARGFHVLRFDPAGVGDSEGEMAPGNELSLDLWGMIQRGLFVGDTVAANDFFRHEAVLDRLIVMGQCGGAATALLATAADETVNGLILVDLPMRILSSRLDFDLFWNDIATPMERLKRIVRRGLGLLFRRGTPGTRQRTEQTPSAGRGDNNGPEPSSAAGTLNLPLLQAARNYLHHGRRMALIFAEHDFALREYDRYFVPAFRAEDGSLPKNITVQVVKRANHVYADQESQDELHGHVVRFMDDFSRKQALP